MSIQGSLSVTSLVSLVRVVPPLPLSEFSPKADSIIPRRRQISQLKLPGELSFEICHLKFNLKC